MENSLPVIFVVFQIKKIVENWKYDWNQLKVDTQLEMDIYMHNKL